LEEVAGSKADLEDGGTVDRQVPAFATEVGIFVCIVGE